MLRAGWRRRQAGFGLVDLLISSALSLFLLAGLLTTYVATVEGHNSIAKLTRLDNELHGLMDLMTRDIRRAGSNGSPLSLNTGAANPFELDIPAAYTGEAANSCLTFSYDLDADGVLDTVATDERLGFRLKDAAVQMRNNGLSCSADGSPVNWENVTDKQVVEITSLSFTRIQNNSEDIISFTLQVMLSGRLKHEPAIARTLTRTIRIRNDLYSPI